ncbi:methylosome subunit pICln-like [Panonychus citri]|uniref:methylosome subunit pICln-like n=1 Tax=Panonychus citri TaxID=50023 RepID=UPI002307928A|nr:methylosome subunit pICln-like [Panonychus citri]
MIITLQPNIITPDPDSIRHLENAVSLYNGNTFLGKGNLYISEQTLTWINPEDSSGINFTYFDITCHAISTDQSTFDHPCIYMMVQVENFKEPKNGQSINQEGDGDNDEGEDEEEFEPDDYEEIRLVPENRQSLQLLYNILCVCQTLNPDEESIENQL